MSVKPYLRLQQVSPFHTKSYVRRGSKAVRFCYEKKSVSRLSGELKPYIHIVLEVHAVLPLDTPLVCMGGIVCPT